MQKIKYLIRSILHFNQTKKCPFCNNTVLKKIDSKYLFTSLLKCENCELSHRHPKDNEKWLQKFYQSEYDIETAMMTKLPTDIELVHLKKEVFSSIRSYDKYIDALFKKTPKNTVKILDYGCSWGYNIYKLINSGYDVIGYELSMPRAKFGEEKLGVKIIHKEVQLPSKFNVLFSSHVIEHLSDINKFILLSKKLLDNDGVFIAFCPNGSESYSKREPKTYHVNWGAVHPNYLSTEFSQFAFKDNPYLILTGDWDFDTQEIADWDGLSQTVGLKKDGKELLIISKPNIKLGTNF